MAEGTRKGPKLVVWEVGENNLKARDRPVERKENRYGFSLKKQFEALRGETSGTLSPNGGISSGHHYLEMQKRGKKKQAGRTALLAQQNYLDERHGLYAIISNPSGDKA